MAHKLKYMFSPSKPAGFARHLGEIQYTKNIHAKTGSKQRI